MRQVALSIIAVVGFPALAIGQAEFVLDANGRTIKAASHVSSHRSFGIAMPVPSDLPLCGKTFHPGALVLNYTESKSLTDPDVLPDDAKSATYDSNVKGFKIRPSQSGTIVYNITQRKIADQDLRGCADLVDAKKQLLASRKAAVVQTETAATAAETALNRQEALVKSLQQDAASFAGIGGTADNVTKILERVDDARKELEDRQKELDDARKRFESAKKSLDDLPDEVVKELNATLEDAEYLLTSLRSGAVMKVGIVFVADGREAVFYNFTAQPANSTLHLQPLGDYPVVTQDERVFAIIANVDTKRHPYPFRLSASVTAGTPINTEPVRPTFPAGGESAFAAAPDRPVSVRAFRDIVLPVRETVPPNGIVEITIQTERPTAADPKKLETVILVEKAKYPQFRARYRYNFSTGVFRSSLRARQFTKVKIQDDDPATKDVNEEALYRTDVLEADPTIQPGVAVSYYVFPVDIQSRAGWREWLPAPTLGFGFNKPQDNVYVGFSHEPWRNVQLFWGWHWGMATEEIVRNTISEDKDAAAPVTRDRREAHFAWGMSFNIAVIAKVFK